MHWKWISVKMVNEHRFTATELTKAMEKKMWRYGICWISLGICTVLRRRGKLVSLYVAAGGASTHETSCGRKISCLSSGGSSLLFFLLVGSARRRDEAASGCGLMGVCKSFRPNNRLKFRIQKVKLCPSECFKLLLILRNSGWMIRKGPKGHIVPSLHTVGQITSVNGWPTTRFNNKFSRLNYQRYYSLGARHENMFSCTHRGFIPGKSWNWKMERNIWATRGSNNIKKASGQVRWRMDEMNLSI